MGDTFMKEFTLLVSTSTVQSLNGGHLHEGVHSAGEYLYCTVTQWGDTFMKELTLLVSTSTVQSLYWEVTFMKELTLLVSTSTVPYY